MPFTLAHPSILYPLRWLNKKYISLTALVIGSLSPDFEYFIWMSPDSYLSHSISGIYLFNLPVTFLFAFLFHIVIKRPLLFHFPFLKNKYVLPPYDYAAYLKKNWVVFILSALVGIASHLFWDGFTHAQGHFVRNNFYLLEKINIGSVEIRRCYIAWYLCSIVGLLIVAVNVIDWRKVFSRKTYFNLSQNSGKYWAMFFVVAIAIMLLRIWLGLTYNWFRHIIIISVGALMYALIIVSWFENRRLKKNLPGAKII